MPVKKYLDETGLTEVAAHVNSRLKTVTVMPSTASEGAIRMYCGETTSNFIKGHTYQMRPTLEQRLQFSADTTTYFMTQDGTITDVAPTSYSPQIEGIPTVDPETGAELVYMAGNNALVQRLDSDVNTITVDFNKIKSSVMPWWTTGAATGSYNPYTIRNVKLVSITEWVDITPSGSILSVGSVNDLLTAWTSMDDDSTAVVNVTTTFALNADYNIPVGRHFLLKGSDADKTTLWTNDGRIFSATLESSALVWTELHDESLLSKVTSMPDASASYLDKVLLYIGDTGTYEYGKFYKCVSDGETPPFYSWEDAGIGSDPVDGTTIVKDSSTGELSAVQATQSTKGIVKGGNGTQIGSNGEVNVVDRLEEINALPTSTADNLNKCYLLKGTQTGYQTGAIYQCQLVVGSDPAEYEWVLLSANPLTFNSDDFNVANDNVELQPSRRTYKGTRAAWNLLSVAEKTRYGATAFTDDEGGAPTDVSSRMSFNSGYTFTNRQSLLKDGVVYLNGTVNLATPVQVVNSSIGTHQFDLTNNISFVCFVYGDGYLCGTGTITFSTAKTIGLVAYFSTVPTGQLIKSVTFSGSFVIA